MSSDSYTSNSTNTRIRTISKEEASIMVSEFKSGISVLKISRIHNMGVDRTKRILNAEGIETPKRNASIDIKKIKPLLEQGETYRSIAKILGYSESGVQAAATRNGLHVLNRLSYDRAKSESEIKRTIEGAKSQGKQVRISIGIGAKLVYKPKSRKVSPWDDEKDRYLVVVANDGAKITCEHEKGFLETFTRFELQKLFQSGQMRIGGIA